MNCPECGSETVIYVKAKLMPAPKEWDSQQARKTTECRGAAGNYSGCGWSIDGGPVFTDPDEWDIWDERDGMVFLHSKR